MNVRVLVVKKMIDIVKRLDNIVNDLYKFTQDQDDNWYYFLSQCVSDLDSVQQRLENFLAGRRSDFDLGENNDKIDLFLKEFITNEK